MKYDTNEFNGQFTFFILGFEHVHLVFCSNAYVKRYAQRLTADEDVKQNRIRILLIFSSRNIECDSVLFSSACRVREWRRQRLPAFHKFSTIIKNRKMENKKKNVYNNNNSGRAAERQSEKGNSNARNTYPLLFYSQLSNNFHL